MIVRRLAMVLVAVVAVVAATAASPGLRRELRASFTRLPSEFTEVYFASAPWRDGAGGLIRVPVSIVHHGAAPESLTVRASVTRDDARQVATAAVAARPGAVTTATLAVPAPGERGAADYLIEVSLPGRPQTLHYRLAGA